MKADLELIRELIDQQFGEGNSAVVLPNDKVVVLNSAPSDDRMDELITDGIVVGVLRFVMHEMTYRFLPRMRAAKYMGLGIKTSWVVIDEGAVQPVLKSSNVLGPGVIEADNGIRSGDEVVVLTLDRKPLAVGTARMSGENMNKQERGVAVKVRWREEPNIKEPMPGGQDWGKVLEANREYLRSLEDRAIDFVKRTIEKNQDKDMAVAYSGGKDSLVTLDLVLRSGQRPKILFVDTGLEFLETVENVHVVVERYGLDLLDYDAGDAFWHSMKHYGPPGRDFRWCCKSCKLGPTAILIKRNFPKGVLAFIGQRGKESEQRFRKQDIWENPWVPGQLGASPIQKWNALEVWLHIFKYDLPYNPLYDQGMARIGCWLCPSQSLSEHDLVAIHPDYEKWGQGLEGFALERGLKGPWLRFGLHRWNRLPKKMKVFLEEKGIEVSEDKEPVESRYRDDTLKLEGIIRGDESIVGRFSFNVALDALGDLLNILGGTKTEGDHILVDRGKWGGAKVYKDRIEVTGEGCDERDVKKVFKVVYRALYCISCGVCIGRCPQDALTIDEGTRKVKLDPNNCVQCGECIGKCPVIEFPPR
jgi:phosphoadenosine phosphosulfate reductase